MLQCGYCVQRIEDNSLAKKNSFSTYRSVITSGRYAFITRRLPVRIIPSRDMMVPNYYEHLNCLQAIAGIALIKSVFPS